MKKFFFCGIFALLLNSVHADSVVSLKSPIIPLSHLSKEAKRYIKLGGHFYVRVGERLIDVGAAQPVVNNPNRFSIRLTPEKMDEVLKASPYGILELLGPPPAIEKEVVVQRTPAQIKVLKHQLATQEKSYFAKIKLLQELHKKKLSAPGDKSSESYQDAVEDLQFDIEDATDELGDVQKRMQSVETYTKKVEEFPENYTADMLVPIDRVFAPAPDTQCKNPVLISDLHGVFVQKPYDECLVKQFEVFQKKYNMTVVLVSTAGSDALEEVNHVDLNRTIALENESDRGVGSADEKKIRIQRALMSSGACILGFSSEDRHREGKVAKDLKIPYFGVYQKSPEDSQTYPRGTRFTKSWCEMLPEIEKQILERRGQAPTPSNIDSSSSPSSSVK